MAQPKQRKPIKAVIKRLIIGAVSRALYICFGVINKINNAAIIVVTLDLYS